MKSKYVIVPNRYKEDEEKTSYVYRHAKTVHARSSFLNPLLPKVT